MPDKDQSSQPDKNERRASDPWGVKKIIAPQSANEQPQSAVHNESPVEEESGPEISVVDPSVEPEVPAGGIAVHMLEDLPEPMGEPIMRLPRIRVVDEESEPSPKPEAEAEVDPLQLDSESLKTPEEETLQPVPRVEPEDVEEVVEDVDDEPPTQLLETSQPVIFKPDEGEPDIEQVTGHFVVTEMGEIVPEHATQESEGVPEEEAPTTVNTIPNESFQPTGKHPKADGDATRGSGFKLTDYWLSLVLTAIIVATGATILILQRYADVLTGSAGEADVKTSIGQINDAPPEAPLPQVTRADTDDNSAQLLPGYQQGQVVFASNRAGDFNLYLLDMRSQAVEQIVGEPDSDERSPVWSPDGTQILFVSNQTGSNNIFLTDQFGDNVIQITDSDASDLSPSWSPDGSRIVFSRETVNGSVLHTITTDCFTGEEGACEAAATPIELEGFNRFPAFTIDGQLIYTTAQFVGRPSRIVRLDPVTDGAVVLTGTGTTDFYAVVSPNGEQIAFVSFAEGDLGDNDIWLMNASGEEAVRLTSNPANDVEPVFSPDGQWLMFASDRGSDNNFEVYALDLACVSELIDDEDACEETVVVVVENLTDDLNPTWTD